MIAAFKDKHYLHPFILWLILLLWFWACQNSFFSNSQSTFDNFIAAQSFWLFNRPPQEAHDIAVIAIDEASRHRLNIKWPWRRSVTANLLRQIAAHSPKVIGLDIVFAGKSQPEEDRSLVSALHSHPRIILGSVFYKNSQEKPEKGFMDAAHSIGFVNKPLQEGLVTATRLFQVTDENNITFSLEAEILISYLELDKSTIRIDPQGAFLGDERFIPAPSGITPLNYLVHPSQIKIIPAAAVLAGKINPIDLRDKIVLVGATDPLIHDEYATPLGVLPGVTIVANSVLMLLSQRFVYGASAAQNVLLSFALGIVVLFVNRRFKFLQNTVYSLVLLAITYLSFVYLRARDFRLDYLLIFFSGCMAYLVPVLYKYLNLLYLSNRLKNLSITDPLTGLYSLRYFLLQLEEIMKARQDFFFVALQLENFKQLALQLNFDQIKRLIGLFAEHLRSTVKQHFKNPVFCRISNDTLGIIFKGAEKKELENFLKTFFPATNALDWELAQQKIRITLQGCLIHGTGLKAGKSDDLMQQMEKLLQEIEVEELRVEEFDPAAAESHTKRQGDILDFITYDWQERNKDLEKAFGEILRANQRLDQLSRGALTALARAIDAKSEWTAGHSERTTRLAVKLGRILKLKDAELQNLYYGGLLHDIGKIGTPAQLLDKVGRLTDQEFNTLREHPCIGGRILEPIDAFVDILPIVKHHHERFDGSGYPDGLAGEGIDLMARIMAVADVFDAMSSDRPYRAGLQPAQVLQTIKENSGSHFDPQVVDALVIVFGNDATYSEEDD